MQETVRSVNERWRRDCTISHCTCVRPSDMYRAGSMALSRGMVSTCRSSSMTLTAMLPHSNELAGTRGNLHTPLHCLQPNVSAIKRRHAVHSRALGSMVDAKAKAATERVIEVGEERVNAKMRCLSQGLLRTQD